MTKYSCARYDGSITTLTLQAVSAEIDKATRTGSERPWRPSRRCKPEARHNGYHKQHRSRVPIKRQ